MEKQQVEKIPFEEVLNKTGEYQLTVVLITV